MPLPERAVGVTAVLTRDLRRRCSDLVMDLDIPRPWDFEEFRSRLERQRGRALHLIALPANADLPCGLCIPAATTDYIYYAPGTTELHREHIALHEIGHLLCEHNDGLTSVDLAPLLLPNIDPATVTHVLGRTAYTSDAEKEAETFASLVLGRAVRRNARYPGDADAEPPVAGVPLRTLDRLSLTLERPIGLRVART